MLTPFPISTIGGISTYVRNLHNGLEFEGHHVVEIPIPNTRGPPAFGLPSFMDRVARAVKGLGSAVLHAHGTWQTAVPLPFHRQCTRVFSFHTEPQLQRRRTRAIVRTMLRWTDQATTVSSYLRNRIESAQPGVRVRVIPPVVETSVNLPTRSLARDFLRIPQEAYVLAFASPLEYREKVAGLRILFDALAMAPRHFVAVIAGGGSLLPFVRDEARSAGVDSRVLMLGSVPEVRLLFAAADVYVQASLKESLGIALLEAMAANVPVLGFPIGAVPETIENGKTGTISPPDPHSLLDRMLYLKENPEIALELAAAGRLFVQERYSWKAIYPLWKEVYGV